MADNAAQSIKDLGTDIEKLDKKIKDSIEALKSFGVNVNDLFAKARESGIANTDKLVTYLAKRLSNLQIKNFAEPFIKSFGIKEAKQEVDKVPTMFDRVIEQINQKAKQAGDNFAKKLVDAEGVQSEAQKAFAALKSEYEKAAKGLSSNEIANQILLQRGQVDLSMLTTAGRKKYLAKMEKEQALLGVPQVTPELVQNIARAQNALNAAQQRYAEVLRQSNVEQEKFAAKLSAIQGVSDKYNNINTQIENLRNKFAELYVKKEAGLIDEATFKKQSDAILNKYDELIKKRNEFETATNIDVVSSERQRQRLQEEERLAQLRKSNTQARLDDEMRAERTIKQAKAERAKKEVEANANMKKAVSQQMTNLKQLSSLQKQYNQLKDIKGRTSEENAALEQTKKKIKEIVSEMYKLNKEQYGSLWKARDITEYDRILAKDKEITRERQKQNDLTKQQKANLNSLLPTLQRLASAFGVAFSVRGLAQFAKQLVKTRGEFEMQFVAMKQIIGDVDAATKIWNQTMQQALQSPFKAMELVKYTKQLAAYRIETDKLFDTTKRLADVSAGLGVDMQRLILAYGQVKAANFLRASEIRQFTEAGVNILGELASYFTEIRGHAYSTAQVMEMVTKRMVRFEDVEAIFKRMTDAGGTFFNMQEVQANTVKGQINKLHDAYDQMLNTIGQANQGVLRNFISLLIDMVKNWQKVANTMKWVGGILGSIIIATRAMRIEMEATAFAEAGTAISLRGLSGAMARYIAAAKGAETATRGFSLALKSVPVWGWILAGVSALIGVGSAIASKQRQIREETEAFNESTRELRKDIAYVDSYTDAIVKLSQEINALNAVENKSEEQEKRLVEAQEERERLIKELAETNPQYANTIKALKNDVDALLASEKEELETLKATLAIRQALKDEGVKGKVEEYESATAAENKAVSDIENNKIAIIDYIGTLNEAGEVESKLLDNLRKQSGTMSAIGKEGMSELESEVESFARAVNEDILNFDEAYGKFVDLYTKLSNGISKSAGQGAYYSNFIQVFKDAAQYGKALSDAQWDTYSAEIAIKGVLDEVFSKYKYYEQYISLSKAFEAATTEEEKQKIRAQILKFWSDVFDQEGFTGASRKLAENYFVSMIGGDFGIKSFSQSSATTKKALGDWQKRVNEAIDKASKGFNEKRAQLSKEAQDNMLEIELYKIKDPFQTLEDAQSDILTRLKEVRARIASYEVKGQVAIDNAEYQALKLTEQEMEQVRVLLGAVTKVTGGGGHKENASKLISLIKEMRSEYDKLSKSAYGYAKSEEKVREAYKDSVKKILGKAGITDYDFTTNEGMIKALEKVKSYATKLGKDAAAEVQKYIDQLETEIEINAQVRFREDFGKQMEKSFNDYELTLELDKLNISPEAAKDLFPAFDPQTLGQMQDIMKRFYEEKEEQGVAFDEDDLKEFQKWADKIDAEILKSRKDRAKEYSRFLEKEYSERAKVEMQYAKDVAFVTANFSGQQQKNILEGLNDKFQKDISELNWKSFKESSFYVEMMDDLSSVPIEYMKIMLSKIEEILQNPEALPPRALKEAINARQKIIEAQMDFDQIAVMKESMAEIREAAKDEDVGGKNWRQTKKRLDEEQKAQAEKLAGIEQEIRANEKLQGQLKGLEDRQKAFNDARKDLSSETISDLGELNDPQSLMNEYEADIAVWQKRVEELKSAEGEATSETKDEIVKLEERIRLRQIEIGLLEKYKESLRGLGAYESTEEGQAAVQAQGAGQTSTSVGGKITQGKKDAENVTKRLSTLQKWQKAFKNFNDSFSKFNKNAADMVGRLGALSTAAFDLYDALGGETDAMTEAWKEFGGTIVNTITQALTMIPTLVAGFVTAGTAINAAMGIIGLIAEAIQLVLVLITGLAKLHDAGYEAEIERQQKKIDELQRAYDRLEKQIEKTWDTASYIRTYNEETQNLYAQIEALNKQIAAENAKKDTDADKIQGYKDSIRDAEDELEELKQKQIEVFGGIGEEGYRDAAQEFVDAWKSAFLETGDGLQGLQEHFDEFLNDWFVKQATMRVAGRMLEPLFRQIDSAVDQYSNGGANVLMQELQEVREKFGVLAPQLSEALEELAGMWGLGGEGALSGLAAGIQGMTEEQANILEAYWNSVRGYTASIDFNVARIADMMASETEGRGVDFNPMLQQLNLIAANTQATHQLLLSVTKSGHSQGGYGIKVFAD